MMINLWQIFSVVFFASASAFHQHHHQSHQRLPSLRSSSFVPPEPKPLQVTRPEQLPDLLSASVALALRLGTGTFVLGWKPLGTFEFGKYPVWGPMIADTEYSLKLGPVRYRDGSEFALRPPPEKPLVLYEYESSPYCRKVREAACMLDIPVEMRPCPGARAGYSDELFDLTNSRMVPYLSDPNTGTAMFESDAIIDYMLRTYGPTDIDEGAASSAMWTLRGGFALWTSAFAALVRGFPASSRKSNAKPENERLEKPLVLYAYEQSPFVRKCRETLCELCVPHVVVPCSRGSRNRDALFAKTGRFQVPYLEDPNSGVALFESNEIIEYLNDQYTV